MTDEVTNVRTPSAAAPKKSFESTSQSEGFTNRSLQQEPQTSRHRMTGIYQDGFPRSSELPMNVYASKSFPKSIH
jgi:hypothetical protein